MMMILMNTLNPNTMHRVFVLLLITSLLLGTSTCRGKSNAKCAASSCGEIQNISYPFRLKGDPKGCGRREYELACENNSTVLYLYNGRYYVRSINYTYEYLTVVDDGLQKDNRFSLPRYTLTCSNFTYHDPYYCFVDLTFSILNCSKPVAPPSYGTATQYSSSNVNYYLYALPNAKVSDVKDFCTIYSTVLTGNDDLTPEEVNQLNSYESIHNMMVDGFSLYISFSPSTRYFYCYIGLPYVFNRPGWCGYGYYPPGLYSTRTITVHVLKAMAYDFAFLSVHFIAAKFILGAPFVLIFLIYKWRRRHLAMDANVEKFLQANNNFLPIRYSYSNIKKVTKNFKHKLGEGGYGSVYRGTLRSGIEVAIKVLKESKGNGQDFINEVATIGRIHHVNVVQLIGYCIEGSKQALVYHFMSNGSLDKHIFSRVDGTSLDCKKSYEIALGVARGIEYLHQGCDMQILHFDIKPHNILLDDNFTPKVSDFGLARLYPTDRSNVSLTAARGTLGYMAPEFFYKDIGGISYKADVYSFGMLLMEMANRRRNFNANAEHSSQIYFPLWTYDQLDKKKLMVLEEVIDEEREIIMKMTIVALWCIQLSPSYRPSMRRVINMLVGDINELQVPPKPLLYPVDQTSVVGNGETEIELETISCLPSAPLIATTSQFESTYEIWGGSTL